MAAKAAPALAARRMAPTPMNSAVVVTFIPYTSILSGGDALCGCQAVLLRNERNSASHKGPPRPGKERVNLCWLARCLVRALRAKVLRRPWV